MMKTLPEMIPLESSLVNNTDIQWRHSMKTFNEYIERKICLCVCILWWIRPWPVTDQSVALFAFPDESEPIFAFPDKYVQGLSPINLHQCLHSPSKRLGPVTDESVHIFAFPDEYLLGLTIMNLCWCWPSLIIPCQYLPSWLKMYQYLQTRMKMCLSQ